MDRCHSRGPPSPTNDIRRCYHPMKTPTIFLLIVTAAAMSLVPVTRAEPLAKSKSARKSPR